MRQRFTVPYGWHHYPLIEKNELNASSIGTYVYGDCISVHIREFKPTSPWDDTYDVRAIVVDGDSENNYPYRVIIPWGWYRTKHTYNGTVVDINGIEVPLRCFGFRKIHGHWYTGVEMEHLNDLYMEWTQYRKCVGATYYRNRHNLHTATQKALKIFYRGAVADYKWLDCIGLQDIARAFMCEAEKNCGY